VVLVPEEIRPTEMDEPAAPKRRLLGWLGLLALAASALVASNAFSLRDDLFGSAIPKAAAPVASRDAFASVQDTAAAPTTLRSNPWWQKVTTLKGDGPVASTPFVIADAAIQWRAKASCASGSLQATAPKQTRPFVQAACPKRAVGLASGTGAMRLDVKATGPWSLEVEQQIDAPLAEPPWASMTGAGARKVATGSFHKIDKTGKGTVAIYRLANGRYALRLDRFFVSPTYDLEVRLSPRPDPRTSQEFTSAPSTRVSTMDVTAGSLNYNVPAGTDITRFKSVVIWCAATRSAYAAAALRTSR